MKLLHVITDMDPRMGGVCQAVRSIAKGLSDLNIHNEVVSLDSPDAPFLKNEGLTIHCLGPKSGPWQYSNKLIPWLVENIAHYDAVIIHGLWLYHGFAVRKVINSLKENPKSLKIPNLFVMPHGMLDPYFQRAEGRRLKAIRNWVYWRLIESYNVNSADGILFTCEEECRLARGTFGPYKPKKECVVGLGLEEPPAYIDDMRSAFLQKCPEVSTHPYILFLSRIHEKKGVDLLVKAYSKIRANKSGDTLPKLVIAGPGIETSFGEQIKKLVISEKLTNDVFLIGMVGGNEKWGAFYGCESFVLPSHQENFGIAVVESLACGRPVLITNQVNIWREIESKGGGIVEDDTEAGIVRLLEEWIQVQPDGKVIFENRAYETYRSHFSIDATSKLLRQYLINPGVPLQAGSVK